MSGAATLLGGGRTRSEVVRIGDTVHRAPTPNAGFVRSLLRHLAAVGFDGAPRYLGNDDCGREVLSYLPGTVPSELGDYPDDVLQHAARLIRRYHDATAQLFDSAPARAAGIEVACHNDLSPCNTVFRGGGPVGLIDFDAAAPGSRAYDLGYAAWLWLDLGNDDWTPAEQLRRLGVFLAAYGSSPQASTVVEAAVLRQTILIAEGLRIGKPAMRDWAAGCHRWTRDNLAPMVASAPGV